MTARWRLLQARAGRTKKGRKIKTTNNSKPFDRQFWDHLAVPYSDIPKCQKEYFSLFPSSLFHVILLCVCCVCVLSRKSLSRPVRFFPRKKALLHCCVLVLEFRLAHKSENSERYGKVHEEQMRARHETSRSTVRKMKNVSDYKHTHTNTNNVRQDSGAQEKKKSTCRDGHWAYFFS